MTVREWLTPTEAASILECSDQTVIARIKNGEFTQEDIQIKPKGSRPRYLVRAEALGQKERSQESESGPAEASSAATGADPVNQEAARLRRELAEVIAERDRLRAEVVTLKDSALHLTRAVEAFLLPGTIND